MNKGPKAAWPGALALCCALGTLLLAQASTRTATTTEALITYPVFFHGKNVVVRQGTQEERGVTRLVIPEPQGQEPRSVFVLWRERPVISDGEIRGEFWDLGRLEPNDSRFSGYDFTPILEIASAGRWPPRDQVFVITGATMVESALPVNPTLRAIALAPEKYADRGVTISGRFRGRNLYGDLPQPINKSKWDFVLQSADAAVWITGIRPRSKDFDLDPGARVDTGRWIEVTGVVRHSGPAVWVEGESVRMSKPPSETSVEITVPALPQEAPPKVIFSAPMIDDTDVDRLAPIRIQFSRDMAPKSFEGHVKVSYVAPPQGGTPPPPVPKFTVHYNEGNRSIEIRFADPLDRFRLVRVDLLEGITATDGQALPPWAVTFTTGT